MINTKPEQHHYAVQKHPQQCHHHQTTTTHRAPNTIEDTKKEDKEKNIFKS